MLCEYSRLFRQCTSNMEILTTKEVEPLVERIIKEENIKNASLIISKGSEKGDGYLSCMTKVDIVGENKTLHLMIKSAPKQIEIRNMLPIAMFYCREIIMYSQIFPKMQTFQEDENVQEPFNAFAKCYKTCLKENEECLVLENIKEAGYKLWNRQEMMPEDHIILVLQQYGKFHGISYAMKDQQPEVYKTMEKVLPNVFTSSTFSKEMITSLNDSMDCLKDLFNPETEAAYYEKALNLKEVFDTFRNWQDNFPGYFTVVSHGDCWCNNIMFKYEDPGNPLKPTKLCLIDFQISKLTSPAIDLSYFFYFAASKEQMSNVDQYLKIYHDSLRSYVKELGSDPDKLFTFDNLKSEWKNYCNYGFFMSTMVLKTMTREQDELIGFDDVASQSTNAMDVFAGKNKNDEVVNQRIKDHLIHQFENGYL